MTRSTRKALAVAGVLVGLPLVLVGLFSAWHGLTEIDWQAVSTDALQDLGLGIGGVLAGLGLLILAVREAMR